MYQIVQIDHKSRVSLRLLERAFHEIYIPAFPDVRERDSLGLWLDFLDEGNLCILVAGNDLDRPDTSALVAIAVAYYNPPANAGELSYIAITPQARGTGLARELLRLRVKALHRMAQASGHDAPDGIFIEVHDPARISAQHDVMDPAKRLAIYRHWGARIINIPYVQVSEAGVERARNLLLLSYPVDGRHPTNAQIGVFLVERYRDYGCINPESDPDVLAMLSVLSAAKSN